MKKNPSTTTITKQSEIKDPSKVSKTSKVKEETKDAGEKGTLKRDPAQKTTQKKINKKEQYYIGNANNNNNNANANNNVNQSQGSQPRRESCSSSQIPRNVNTYSHFLQHQYITEKDIEWVLQLRNKDDKMKEKLDRIPNATFNVFDKKIKSQEQHHSTKSLSNCNATQLGQVEHLVRRRLGPTPTVGLVEFETGLRTYTAADKKLRDLERGWTTIPRKDRKEFPEFLPPLQEELKVRKQIKDIELQMSTAKDAAQRKEIRLKQKEIKLTHSGFDGYQEYEKYDAKLKVKNIADAKHLCEPSAFVSTIKWQLNLR